MIPIFGIISNNKIKGRGHRGKGLRSVARRDAPYIIRRMQAPDWFNHRFPLKVFVQKSEQTNHRVCK
jgi:hypothetical protein